MRFYLDCCRLTIVSIGVLYVDWFLIASSFLIQLLVALKVLRCTPLAWICTPRLLGHIQLLHIDVRVRLPERHAFHRAALNRSLRSISKDDFLVSVPSFPQICLALLPFMLTFTRPRSSDSRLLARLGGLCCVLPVPISLDPIESSVHVVVLEVRTRLRTLILLPSFIIKIDPLVVDEIHGSIVSCLIIFLVVLWCLSGSPIDRKSKIKNWKRTTPVTYCSCSELSWKSLSSCMVVQSFVCPGSFTIDGCLSFTCLIINF